MIMRYALKRQDKMAGMVTILIDIMVNNRFYATYKYKHCPAFKFDIQDAESKVLERYPSLQTKQRHGANVNLVIYTKN